MPMRSTRRCAATISYRRGRVLELHLAHHSHLPRQLQSTQVIVRVCLRLLIVAAFASFSSIGFSRCLRRCCGCRRSSASWPASSGASGHSMARSTTGMKRRDMLRCSAWRMPFQPDPCVRKPMQAGSKKPRPPRHSNALRAWQLALLRFAVTLDNADRLALLAIATELDAPGVRPPARPAFSFFGQATAELCHAILNPRHPATRAVLQRHLDRSDDERIKRALAAMFAIDMPRARPLAARRAATCGGAPSRRASGSARKNRSRLKQTTVYALLMRMPVPRSRIQMRPVRYRSLAGRGGFGRGADRKQECNHGKGR